MEEPLNQEAKYPGLAPISNYGNGGFRFADMSHQGSLLLLPSGIYAWDATDFSSLDVEHFNTVFLQAGAIEFLLLGCGPNLQIPSQEIRDAFEAQDVGLEFMDTGAAVRTYNVLLAEKRAVAAALIAVENP